MLTGHKVPQHKVNNVTGVLQSSKPYFAWHIQQSVAANSMFSVTRSLYCMCQVSQCHSYLLTTPSSCILLTLASFCNQNLTCSTPSSLSSFCRISFILGKLKTELTKKPLHHTGKNGEHFCGGNLYNGDKNGEHFWGQNFHQNNMKRHIKSHHTWQCSKHPCSLDDNKTWTPLMGPASQELAVGTSKRKHPNMDPASWMLTGEEKSRLTTQVNACSLKLIGELM